MDLSHVHAQRWMRNTCDSEVLPLLNLVGILCKQILAKNCGGSQKRIRPFIWRLVSRPAGQHTLRITQRSMLFLDTKCCDDARSDACGAHGLSPDVRYDMSITANLHRSTTRHRRPRIERVAPNPASQLSLASPIKVSLPCAPYAFLTPFAATSITSPVALLET
jgi:hypothetical protein